MSLKFNIEIEHYIKMTELNYALSKDRFKIKYNLKKKYFNFFKINENDGKISKLYFELHLRKYFMDNNLQKDFTTIGLNNEIADLFNLDIKSNYNLDIFITNLFQEVIETKFEIEI
jgi:hypothetical protein